MVKFMDKKEIIRLKENGLSDREVARQTKYNRGNGVEILERV